MMFSSLYLSAVLSLGLVAYITRLAIRDLGAWLARRRLAQRTAAVQAELREMTLRRYELDAVAETSPYRRS